MGVFVTCNSYGKRFYLGAWRKAKVHEVLPDNMYWITTAKGGYKCSGANLRNIHDEEKMVEEKSDEANPVGAPKRSQIHQLPDGTLAQIPQGHHTEGGYLVDDREPQLNLPEAPKKLVSPTDGGRRGPDVTRRLRLRRSRSSFSQAVEKRLELTRRNTI